MVGGAAGTQTRRMDISLDLGILFALVCAAVTNLAFLFKHLGASAAPAVDIRHPLASAAGLFRSRWFSIGWLVAAAAWVFHVLALALAPISVVQVVLAGGLVLLAVMADRMFGFTVGGRQWVGLTAMAVGLGLIVLTQPAVEDAHSSFSVPAMAAFQAGLFGLGALLIFGPRLLGARAKGRGQALGAASGLLFGASDVALKALTGLLGSGGVLGLVSPWALVAALASVTSFYASARALQDGEAVPVIAITGTAANIVGIAGGIVVFGDPLPGDTLGIVLQAVGFLLVVAAAALTPAPVRAAGIEDRPGSAAEGPRERPAAGRPRHRNDYIRRVRGIDSSGRTVEARG
jgi:hypothetical protein